MIDVAPELLDKVQKQFSKKLTADDEVARFIYLLQKGEVTQINAQEYSAAIGKILGETLSTVITPGTLPDGKLYWNIAERVINPMLKNNHKLSMLAAESVQKVLDEKNGIGLSVIKPEFPEEKADSLMNYITENGLTEQQLASRLNEPIQSLTEEFFDAFVRENAQFRYEAGMSPQIVRVYAAAKPCAWCRSMAGTYDYSNVSDKGNDVFKRHDRCHCQVYFKDNKWKKIQAVHSKRVIEKPANAAELFTLDDLDMSDKAKSRRRQKALSQLKHTNIEAYRKAVSGKK